jgi:single-strand DNA-binding protein
MYIRITLIGNLGRDPELSYTPGGQAITRFSVATNRRWTDKASGERKEETTWVNCTAFDRLAETCNTYLRKGSKVFIEGRPAARAWLGKQGDAQASLDVVMSDMVMLDPKGTHDETGQDATADTSGDVPF